MTNQQKNVLRIVKSYMDEARQKIDIVRFQTEPPLSEEEYQGLSGVFDLLCNATDKLHNVV